MLHLNLLNIEENDKEGSWEWLVNMDPVKNDIIYFFFYI